MTAARGRMVFWFGIALVVAFFMTACDGPTPSDIPQIQAQDRSLSEVNSVNELPFHVHSLTRVKNNTDVLIAIWCEQDTLPVVPVDAGVTFPGYNPGECVGQMFVYLPE